MAPISVPGPTPANELLFDMFLEDQPPCAPRERPLEADDEVVGFVLRMSREEEEQLHAQERDRLQALAHLTRLQHILPRMKEMLRDNHKPVLRHHLMLDFDPLYLFCFALYI